MVVIIYGELERCGPYESPLKYKLNLSVPLHYSMKRSDLNVSIEYDHVEVTAFKNQTLLEGFLFDKIDKEDGASFWEIEYFNYRRCIKVWITRAKCNHVYLHFKISLTCEQISLVKRERYTWNYCFKKYGKEVRYKYSSSKRNLKELTYLFDDVNVLWHKRFPEYVDDTNINLRHHKQINFATAADWAERQKNT